MVAREEYFQGFHIRVLQSPKGRVRISLPMEEKEEFHYFLLRHGFSYNEEQQRFEKYVGHIDLQARGVQPGDYTANKLVIEVNELTKRVRYTAYLLSYSKESDLLRNWELLEGLILGDS